MISVFIFFEHRFEESAEFATIEQAHAFQQGVLYGAGCGAIGVYMLPDEHEAMLEFESIAEIERARAAIPTTRFS